MSTFKDLFNRLCSENSRELAQHLARTLRVDEGAARTAVDTFTLETSGSVSRVEPSAHAEPPTPEPNGEPDGPVFFLGPHATASGATARRDEPRRREAKRNPGWRDPGYTALETKHGMPDAPGSRAIPESKYPVDDESPIIICTFYSPACHAVFGDAAKQAASALGFVFRQRLSHGPGWTFPLSRLDKLTQELKRRGLTYKVVPSAGAAHGGADKDVHEKARTDVAKDDDAKDDDAKDDDTKDDDADDDDADDNNTAEADDADDNDADVDGDVPDAEDHADDDTADEDSDDEDTDEDSDDADEEESDKDADADGDEDSDDEVDDSGSDDGSD